MTEHQRLEVELATAAFMKLIRSDKEKAQYAVKFITLHEHRTNQQLFFKNFIINLLKEYANKEDGRYDLRNEDTVKFCKSIKEELDSATFSYI
jgi:hypothetical protein